jgi:hypothetical protein
MAALSGARSSGQYYLFGEQDNIEGVIHIKYLSNNFSNWIAYFNFKRGNKADD